MKKIIYSIILFASIFVLSNSVNAWSKYEVGDKVTYKGIDFYVIKDSEKNKDSVTMIKDNALKSSEMKDYLASTEIIGKVIIDDTLRYNVLNIVDEYLEVAYYMESNCKTGGNNTGCNFDYSLSDIKQVVDVWANNYLNINDLVEDSTGYKARLITYDELTNDLGMQISIVDPTNIKITQTKNIANWFFIDNSFWTMSQLQDFNDSLWVVSNEKMYYARSYNWGCVRPVITIKKSALGDINEQEEIDKDDKGTISDNNSNKESKVSVNVPNTMQKISVLLIMVGVISLSISRFLVIKNKHIIKNK